MIDLQKIQNQVEAGFKIMKDINPVYLADIFDDVNLTLNGESLGDEEERVFKAFDSYDMYHALTNIKGFGPPLVYMDEAALKNLGIYPKGPLESQFATSVWVELIHTDYLNFQKYLMEYGAYEMENGATLSQAEYFFTDYQGKIGGTTFSVEGDNSVNADALAVHIGPAAMQALHALYHELGYNVFHNWLVDPDVEFYPGYHVGHDTQHTINAKELFIEPKEQENEDEFEAYAKKDVINEPGMSIFDPYQ